MRPSTAWGPGGGAQAPGRLVLALMDGWDQNGRGMAGGVQSMRAGGRLLRSKPRRTGCEKCGGSWGTEHWGLATGLSH